jgi:hypothetical protein
MRSPSAVVVALTVAGVLSLVAAALVSKRVQAFTLGVATATVVEIAPHHEICQAPITVPASFDGVTLRVGTNGHPGPRLEVSVRHIVGRGARPNRGGVITTGALPAGYPDVDQVPEHTVRVAEVASGRTVAVCLANRGRRSAFVYGDADAAARSSQASLDGKPLGVDLAVSFARRTPQSVAGLVPVMLDRAALFRARGIGPWTYVVLALLVLLAAPALLVRALRSVQRTDEPGPPPGWGSRR